MDFRERMCFRPSQWDDLWGVLVSYTWLSDLTVRTNAHAKTVSRNVSVALCL